MPKWAVSFFLKADRRPASTTLDGRLFHDLMILVEKEYLYALTVFSLVFRVTDK